LRNERYCGDGDEDAQGQELSEQLSAIHAHGRGWEEEGRKVGRVENECSLFK